MVVWTTGLSAVRRGSMWPTVAPDVEGKERLDLDVKENRWLGRKDGKRGPGLAYGSRAVGNESLDLFTEALGRNR